jgi:hypothetical protein
MHRQAASRLPGLPGLERKSAPEPVKADEHALAERLLRLLAEGDRHARREEDSVIVVAIRKGVSTPVARLPARALAPLLASGAVRCRLEAGQSRFMLTAEGRAALFRQARPVEERFGAQHREMALRADPDQPGASVSVNLREDPLAMLARQDADLPYAPGASGLAAAERLRLDIERASLPPKMTLNWERLVVDGAQPGQGLQLSEQQAAARQRVNAALRAVGPDFAGPLFDLCGFGTGIGAFEREAGLPVRSGKVVIGLALRALARHYGLASEAVGPDHARLRRWGTPDSRPDFPKG